jgi:hypothetical protein
MFCRKPFSLTRHQTILAHLTSNYGTRSSTDLEENRDKLKAPWSPNDEIETLWTRVAECKNLAAGTTETITDAIVMRLLLIPLEKAGVLTLYAGEWNRKLPADQTYPAFKLFFSAANKERKRQMTAGTAGYHALHAATVPSSPSDDATAATAPAPAPSYAAAAATTPAAAPRIISNLVEMFYCWSHGLCTNPLHTSQSCNRPRDGHKTDATAANMMGGNNTIIGSGRNNRRGPRTGARE